MAGDRKRGVADAQGEPSCVQYHTYTPHPALTRSSSSQRRNESRSHLQCGGDSFKTYTYDLNNDDEDELVSIHACFWAVEGAVQHEASFEIFTGKLPCTADAISQTETREHSEIIEPTDEPSNMKLDKSERLPNETPTQEAQVTRDLVIGNCIYDRNLHKLLVHPCPCGSLPANIPSPTTPAETRATRRGRRGAKGRRRSTPAITRIFVIRSSVERHIEADSEAPTRTDLDTDKPGIRVGDTTPDGFC
ncbi:uncharacterized protein FOMMEDRAFT_162539 [Fomitiporia mediterranea MF3/22]|uniref:Uncharacterized protein n=1 Tax=Fomitiporia mediterranea (strain MF3/22) TaxID=694068 RepID=R7SGB1_FOMME|nr:uncharacterized protein FOMMEDRAFT_162539 [Fomitiporia mediterranea MF3/22]EJC97731.1 hypothetical protein FOMMEDRAFT_162539 [Fomitiporia mediterranea MF3/22]